MVIQYHRYEEKTPKQLEFDAWWMGDQKGCLKGVDPSGVTKTFVFFPPLLYTGSVMLSVT
jgi:hypothetical protein